MKKWSILATLDSELEQYTQQAQMFQLQIYVFFE